MSLDSGRKIHSYQWTELTITQQVIDRVHYMAKKQKQPKMIGKAPMHARHRPSGGPHSR